MQRQGFIILVDSLGYTTILDTLVDMTILDTLTYKIAPSLDKFARCGVLWFLTT